MTRAFHLAAAAEADIDRILRTSEEEFGEAARSRYAALISTAIADLLDDPQRPNTLARPELPPGLRTYHLRHARRRAAGAGITVKAPRHLIVYLTPTSDLVVVVRVLHDAMELDRHLPA